ncbi:MAG: response regulator transcription factor [Hamadaea sp.]|uniref:response regulator transcription factor n=1 Tax=Hamadaea sp. NPDC050747 TaxID=3155789 RepID=UPI0017F4BC23|nr:response regulator transcription factor [Hamadaea sp.]NUR51585.1 response regulator transcription factor [Hamadaea sp.]NUT08277.1 response regulator transcription factor [Hamadaea sp.]
MRVLVVEDDRDLREAAVAALRAGGLAVDHAGDWPQADLALSVNAYDCVVLDRMLPDGDSARHLHRLRERGIRVPALMLTALSEIDERVRGFEAGADDYLAKPFAAAELVMRVRALCRRSTAMLPPVLKVSDLELDCARHEVRRAGVLQLLTPKEFAVLEQLMSRAPATVTRADLREHCWDELADPLSNVVDVVITQLRRKLGPPALIHTVRGAGYRIGDE